MAMIPLFQRFPPLKERLPHVALGEFPTPVQRLERLGHELGVGQLYIKRDDLSGRLYGGNKPRKLEFELGKALRSGASEVITFGGTGSNHALATAIYAKQLSLKTISMLIPQPNSHSVRRNLLAEYHYGAELHLCGTSLESSASIQLLKAAALYQVIRHRIKSGKSPHLIPPGGSSPLGVTGFVNAGLELAEQVANGEMPEPDFIYLAAGTMGTSSGLTLGLKVAGMKSRVAAVAVTGGEFANAGLMVKLMGKTVSMLRSLDASFPDLEFTEDDFDIKLGYYGGRYGLYTEEGMKAVTMMKETAGIKLEGTYTGKAAAALIDDARSGELQDKTVLFWNTLNSRDYPAEISSLDYHKLPRAFHRYFEEEVQPLDRDQGGR